MSEGSATGGDEDLPEVVVKKGRGVSIVWVVPVLALAIGAYLAWDAYQNRGISVVITYPSAAWVEAGKTKIKFLDVEVGTVDEVKIVKAAGGGVELHCTLNPDADVVLTKGAQFWIEHPRVGGGQVSGLGTLLSGAFIVMRGGPRDGEKMRRFAGLVSPPVAPSGEKGLRIELHAAELYSIYVGTDVYYLQERVGEVDAYELAADGDGVTLHLFFPEEHAHLVRKDSRFWNASGIQVSASLGHIDVSTQSFASMLSGGIAFDSPGKTKSPAAETGASYWLHATRTAVTEDALRYGGLRVVVEAAHLGGVKVGDPVSYRELTVGEVISQELVADSRRLRVHLNIQDRYARLVRTNTIFWNASGLTADLGLTGLHIRTESMQALLAGGVAFATPDPPGHLVKEGSVFKLHKEVKDKYLAWEPSLGRGESHGSTKAGGAAGAGDPAAGQEAGAQAEDSGKSEKSEKEDKPGFFARFFHHEGKSEEEAAKDAEPEPDAAHHEAHDEKRHGRLRRR